MTFLSLCCALIVVKVVKGLLTHHLKHLLLLIILFMSLWAPCWAFMLILMIRILECVSSMGSSLMSSLRSTSKGHWVRLNLFFPRMPSFDFYFLYRLLIWIIFIIFYIFLHPESCFCIMHYLYYSISLLLYVSICAYFAILWQKNWYH